MRPNDQKFITAILISVIIYFIMVLAIMIHMKSIKGFIICIPVLYVGLCFLIGSTVIYQSRKFTTREIASWIIVNLIYILLGVGYFAFKFKLKEMKFFSSEKSDLKTEACTFVLFYILLTPTFIHGLMFGLRAIDRGVREAYNGKFKGMLICFIIGTVLICLGSFLFLTWKEGVVYLLFIVFLIYTII